jgi:hypothetical protein
MVSKRYETDPSPAENSIGPSAENEDRIFFVDEYYEQGNPPDDNQKFYIHKSIAKLSMNKNSQNPISYLEPRGISPVPVVMERT